MFIFNDLCDLPKIASDLPSISSVKLQKRL
jgi:hypothetical protein